MTTNGNGATSGMINTGRGEALRHVRYEDLLRAIGHYIDQHRYADVIITQIPDGMLLKGTVIEHTAGGPVERVAAVLFTDQDIVALLHESQRQRGDTGRLRPRF